MRIGLSRSPPLLHLAWPDILRPYGQVVEYPLGVPSAAMVDCWLVVLDVHTAPLLLRDWIAHLRAPVILLTPHTSAAQELAGIVRYLAVICHPQRAISGIADLLTMACATHAGTSMIRLAPF